MFSRITFFSFVILLLAGCGGGSGGTTPTPTNTVFSTFPPGFFNGNYLKNYNLTGSDTNNSNYTSTWSIKSGADTTFNGQAVKSIENILTITNTTTNAIASTSVFQYYNTDINNLMFLGSFITTSNETNTATSLNILPLTAKIGDFGTIGSYSSSTGSRETSTWELTDASNGKAKLIETFTSYDAFNVLDTTEIDKYLINPDGSIISIELVITFHQNANLTVTLNSQ